jgi:hypothetical protein
MNAALVPRTRLSPRKVRWRGLAHPGTTRWGAARLQLTAAAFSRAAAAAAAVAHYSAAPAATPQSRGWRNDNAFDVVPPTVQPRSSFFVDEQPAPEPTEPPSYSPPARPSPFSHVTCAPPASLPPRAGFTPQSPPIVTARGSVQTPPPTHHQRWPWPCAPPTPNRRPWPQALTNASGGAWPDDG